MSRLGVTLRGALSVLAGPGIMAGLVPYLLTRWRSPGPSATAVIFGVILIASGAGVLLHAAARFAFEGRGTLAPFAPTQRLIVSGLYRHVRNPMYLAVTGMLIGEALLLGRLVLIVWAGAFSLATATFVRLYEEPTLSKKYSSEYAAYRRAVRGWWPRFRPWTPGTPED
jgi:protein-S-isoprenylcysteine O-methyltransferase Ste14